MTESTGTVAGRSERSALDVPSRLAHVRVFRVGAELRRVFTLSSGAPLVVARLRGLPVELDDASARVEVLGGARGVVVRSVRVQLDVSTSAPSSTSGTSAPTETPPLTTEPPELRDARHAVRELVLRAEALRLRATRATALSLGERPRPEPGKPPPPSPTRARLELLTLRDTLLRETREELESIDDAKRLADARLRTLEEAHARSSRDATFQARLEKHVYVEVELDAEAPSAPELELHYRVRSARWVPTYRLAFDTRSREAVVAMRARIAQDTGEDWDGVRVSVSTARADRWHELPELASVRIGRAQPPSVRKAFRALPADGATLFADYDEALGAPSVFGPPPAVLVRGVPAAPHARTMAGLAAPIAAMAAMAAPMAAPMAPPVAPPARGAVPGALGGVAPLQSAPRPAVSSPRPSAAVERARVAPQAKKASVTAGPAVDDDEDLHAELAYGASFEDGPSFDGGPFGGSQGSDDLPDPHGAPRDVAASLLDFASLELAEPGDARRGSLRAASAPSPHAARAAELVAAAEARFGNLRPPAGHTFPESLYGFDFEYDATQRADIPSDGTFHAVAITERTTRASLLHVTVPREAQEAYRVLELENPLEGALLRGPVDVSFDGTLLTTGSFAPTPERGAIALGVGLDASVKVARNVQFREETAGLMGGSTNLHHAIQIELRNNGARDVRLEVRERIPKTHEGEEDIEVRLGRVTPPFQDLTQDEPHLEGGKRWVIDLAAGRTASLTAEYTVRIASKHELVGGNRREGA